MSLKSDHPNRNTMHYRRAIVSIRDSATMASSTRLTYVGHATVLIEIGGLRIITDPLLRNRIGFFFLQRCASEVNPKSYESIDAVLISHMHPDHLDIHTLRLVGNSAMLIVPKGASRYLNDHGFDKVKEIRIGECIQLDQVKIRSTPAKHSGSRHLFGPSAECLGFVIEGNHFDPCKACIAISNYCKYPRF